MFINRSWLTKITETLSFIFYKGKAQEVEQKLDRKLKKHVCPEKLSIRENCVFRRYSTLSTY